MRESVNACVRSSGPVNSHRPSSDALKRAFGLEFSQAARDAMSAKVAQAPNGGYGANRYLPEEFGIDPERERARASVYIERFGIAS